MNFVEYPDAEMMMMDLANTIAGELEQHLLIHDTASFAVPGGTTPGPVFDALCAARHIDWARVNVMLTDERLVPQDHARSNTRLVKERLLIEAASAANYVSYLPPTDVEGADVAQLSKLVEPHLPISVILLGMGADMHTASIFPNSPDLKMALETPYPLVAVQPPDGLEARLSLSMKALKGAMSRHIVIIGTEKREALERAKTLSPQEAPVSAILAGSTIHWAEN